MSQEVPRAGIRVFEWCPADRLDGPSEALR
jgi:hypothetical protein